MSKFLQKILDIDEPMFSVGLSNLEKATGRSGVDTRTIADITHKAHEIMRSLGLDPSDSTAREVYQSLNSAVKKDKEFMFIDSDFVLMSLGDEVVSFNLIDIVENSHHEISFADRIISHGQRSLRGEIIDRYMSHPMMNHETGLALSSDTRLSVDEDQHHNSRTKHLENTRNNSPFILTIGDIVTDAFIKLKDDEAEVTEQSDGSKRLSMDFGSKPPYEQVDIVQAVGNSANAAVSLSRLGLRAGLMAFIGDDQPGKDSLKYLSDENVDTSTVSVQEGFKSNYHFALRYGADRTILIKYEDYAYNWQEPTVKPNWIYLSMLSENSWQLHEDMMKYLNNNPEIKLAFQPGTFHFKWGVEKLSEIYKRSYIVFMNREEAAMVTGKPLKSVKDLAFALHELGPDIVVITDGPNGAYVSGEYKFLSMPNYPDPAPPYDRTGAGDAFSSTMVAALALGESLETAISWAPINSMSVVQKLGAQAGLLDKDALLSYMKTAPEDYKVQEYTE